VRTQPYLDYHATTPVDPRAVAAMMPYFSERFGNAASRTHGAGRDAQAAVQRARDQIARLIGASREQLVFTSGATESNNLAIQGTAFARRRRGSHVITVATEHRSVLDTCRALESQGFRVTRLSVEPDGLVDLTRLEAALGEDTVLVSVMAANNEIGVLQPIAAIGDLVRRRGIVFHCDASQAVGKIPIDVAAWGVDLLSFTAHKMYGPKGVGALYVRTPEVEPLPLIHGGGHERGLRSGTLNVPAIVGFGEAAAICQEELSAEAPRLTELRDRLLAGLVAGVPDLRVNGSLVHRLPINLHVSIPGVDAETLAPALDTIGVSTGSACSSGASEPSHVLRALGVPDDLARASIRFGLGRWTAAAEIDAAVAHVTMVVTRLRELEAQLQAPSDMIKR
jgi:cysteine desulfurase